MAGARGNKRPGSIAMLLMAGIVVTTAIIVYFAVMGFQKQPHGPPRGSGSLPSQAAQGGGTPPKAGADQ